MTAVNKKKIAIIGGGVSGITLGAFLDSNKFDITIFEKNKTLGRKFLVAGDGGLNLTYNKPVDILIRQYSPSQFLKNAITAFDNKQLRSWLLSIGIPTYVGSSNRIFPEQGIKPIEVLNAMTSVVKSKKVNIEVNSKWNGWSSSNQLIINSKVIQSDYVAFALGGGSWKITGSDGIWRNTFDIKNIRTKILQPSNCAYEVPWPSSFIERFEGSPLKNISISCNGVSHTGEVVVNKFGIEGNAIYALSPQLRKSLQNNESTKISIDLKPMLTIDEIKQRLSLKSKNITTLLREKLKLSKVAVALIKHHTTKEQFMNPDSLIEIIKYLPIEITSTAPIDEAISTVGGICLDEVDHNFQFKKLPNQYCIGEMLDWDAPTGGYLLQANFSMGVYLAKHINSLY